MSRIKVNKLLVYDCEATCDEDKEWTRNNGELIEIGITVIDLVTFEIRQDLEYSSLVKPINTKITEYCTNLTGITQKHVDETGKDYSVVASEIREKYQQRVANGSWGNFDPELIKKTSKLHNVKYPMENTHYNLKNWYSIMSGSTKEFGLQKALQNENMKFEGTPHTALDDARNAARLILKHLKLLRTARIIGNNV